MPKISDRKITSVITLCLLTISTAVGFTEDRGNASAGKVIYKNNCAICHGREGRGNGPVATALNPKPTDLTSPFFSSKSDKELFTVITEGKIGTGMVHFDKVLTEQQRWDVLRYIRMFGGEK